MINKLSNISISIIFVLFGLLFCFDLPLKTYASPLEENDCGDVNLDEAVNIYDATYLIAFLYWGGPEPANELLADVNDDGVINIFDITAIVGYLYLGGGALNCPSMPEPEGEMVWHSGCLDIPVARDTALTEDCIVYEYDGVGKLYLTHLNDLFNCCPDTFLIDISIEDNVISITETEDLSISGGCDCICLYDLNYEINNLPPGTYTIKVDNPYYYYWYGAEEIIEFTVDLATEPSGYFCVDRHYLPWQQVD